MVTIRPSAAPAPSGAPGTLGRRTLLRTALTGLAAVGTVGTLGIAAAHADTALLGQDVSSHQGNVDWAAQKAAGSQFAYCKATQGTTYVNPFFAQQYQGSDGQQILRGAYHYASPAAGGGAAECDYFLKNGGGWSDDGRTLPGMLDVEDNPNGLSQQAMRDWVESFLERYRSQTGRQAVIYTGVWFWDPQVGSDWAPAHTPLHVSHYNDSAPTANELPGSWTGYEIWQFADSGTLAGDNNRWYGSRAQLEDFARSKDYAPVSN